MLGRFFSLLLFAVIGWTLGNLWAESHPQQDANLIVWSGMFAALGVWLLMDVWRGARVVAWLRRADFSLLPTIMGHWGMWGQVIDRVRRIVRARDQSLWQAQQHLQDFLSAIQASPNGVVILNANGQIEWCNQTAASHLGLDPQRDLQQHLIHLIRDPQFVRYMHQSQPEGGVTIEGRLHQPQKPVRISIARHSYGEGKQLLLTRDITDIEQAEAMRRDFVANVSHEIRTPLTVLSGFVETLQTLDLSEADRQRYLQRMAVQSQRMQSLVADLLTLSKLEGSPEPGYGSAYTLREWLGQAQEEAQALSAHVLPSGEHHHITFVCAAELQEAQVLGETKELQSALSNLVSNAIRYTPAGGAIDVHVQVQNDGTLSVLVTDTGPGIAAEHVSRLTERFYRVDRSRSRETGGTGLGLAIVKHVMQRHGGTLQVSSVVGQGSCFSLHFPAARWRRHASNTRS